MTNSNPIISVNGASCPCPSAYEYGFYDVSMSDSGRTEDGTIHKNRIGSSVKLQMQWNAVTPAVASQILKLFGDEYFTLVYFDDNDGANRTGTFYRGDVSVTTIATAIGYRKDVSFNVIERGVHDRS